MGLNKDDLPPLAPPSVPAPAPAPTEEEGEEIEAELADDTSWDAIAAPEPEERATDVGTPTAPGPPIDDEHTEITKGAAPENASASANPSQRPRTPGSYSMTATVERVRPPSSFNVPAATASPIPGEVADKPPTVATNLSMATVAAAPPARSEPPPPSTNVSPLDKDLKARADRLKKEDPVAAARANLELGLLSEWISFDRPRAKKHYDGARELVATLQPALTRARRLGAQPGAAASEISSEVLVVLDHEIDVADTDELRADLHAARARALDSIKKPDDARSAYQAALRLVPRHAGALRGLEVTLRQEITEAHKPLHKELAEHLGQVAETFLPDGNDGDAALGAWVCVERAEILERNLKDIPAAREALKKGVALAPNPGPVRTALVRHLSRHDRDAGLAEALRVEAEREADHDRAARLFYASARIALDRVHARGDAITSLTRGEARAPHGGTTQERLFNELLHQLEIDGDQARMVELRVKRLSLLTKPEVLAHEYVRLADAYGRLGRADLSADAAARALTQDPSNRAIREALDQSLQRLGRHADRVRAWLLEANAERTQRDRVRAFLRAADIAVRHLNNVDQAIDALRGAWMLDPGNGAVFDQLSSLLRAGAAKSDDAKKNAEQRIDLYLQAASQENEKERKIGLLEKVLGLWEDELDRADQAIDVAEQILKLDPKRRSAIVALERTARRAGDTERLLGSLLDEAKQAHDPKLKARLLLEAAELTEKKLDRDKALTLIDGALSAKPGDVDATRMRAALLRRMNRLDEARKTLVQLVEHDPSEAFETWLEIADLDESFRKAPLDAVEAYRAAHKARPEHPLPGLALMRLLRATKNYKRLVSELKTLAKSETDARALAQLLTTAAEVEELCLGDDDAALKSLEAADEALLTVGWDANAFEWMERILFRAGDDEGLMRLYARWLERKPSAAVDHGLRIGLAGALEKSSPAQSIEVLEALVGVVPNHTAALRRLEHLHRARHSHQQLASTLLTQSGVFGSRVARIGALWEIVAMEERVGAAATLDALARITRENPSDIGALDSVIRVASRLVCNVGVPHPALLAARTQLLAALSARRELTVDPLARAAYQIEEAILYESSEVEPNPRAALEGYREALTLWPDSMLAARGLERLGSHLNDHNAVITSQLALAKLADTPIAKAEHLVRAAALTASHLRDERTALELYEVALESDPENREAAKALCKMLAPDPRRLIERLRPALDRASTQVQATLLGGEIAQAYLRIHHQEGEAARLDYGPGIQAIKRAMRATPDDIPSLFLLARLYGAQKTWAESRDTLSRIVELAPATETKLKHTALFGLVDLYEGPLADPTMAESTLVSVLSVDPSNKPALERLYTLGTKNGDKKLARSSLERLAEYETDLAQRTEYQMRVAEACREANDGAGMLRALSDAVVSTPQDLRPFALLARLYRSETQEGAAGLGHALEQIIEMAKARRRPIEPRWLVTLGLLEVNVLKRLNEGLTHLQAALGAASTPGSPSPHPELRAALGSGLLSAGRPKEASQVLRELCTTDAETMLRLNEQSTFNHVRSACVAATGTVLSAVLSCLDAALATEGRSDERLAVEEVRAAMGDVPKERVAKLRSRRLEPEAPYANSLAASELVRTLLPEARTPFIDVAIAIQPVVAKVLRFELGQLGVSSRERIGSRDGHPTRALADRVARCLGVPEFELYLSPGYNGPLRSFPGDPSAILGGLGFAELPETEQAFALGRAITRIALGVTWVEDVPAEVADAILMSAVRSVLPQWGLGEITPQREHALNNVIAAMKSAIGRRQRKSIEELGPTLSGNFDIRGFVNGIRRSEYRTAYVVSGDLLGGLDTMRRTDAELSRAGDNPRSLLQHPLSSELIRFALSAESYAERRRVGTVWGPAV